MNLQLLLKACPHLPFFEARLDLAHWNQDSIQADLAKISNAQ